MLGRAVWQPSLFADCGLSGQSCPMCIGFDRLFTRVCLILSVTSVGPIYVMVEAMSRPLGNDNSHSRYTY
jgi:hypothetical protein